MQNSDLLKDKIALITGATRGIGKATKELFEQQGCMVIGFGRTECNLLFVYDVIRYLANLKVDYLDVLINNAGIFYTQPIEHTLLHEWEESFALNVRAPFMIIRECLRLNLLKKGSVILNINSKDTLTNPINQIAYNCSKMALHGLTLSLNRELTPKGISVTEVFLPSVNTDMMQKVNLASPMPTLILTSEQAAELILVEVVACL